ncbi:MAG TPA: hypothetical protein DEQ14_00125 [Treponema sp.]|nr:hypothetical protein [Treponema sp.]
MNRPPSATQCPRRNIAVRGKISDLAVISPRNAVLLLPSDFSSTKSCNFPPANKTFTGGKIGFSERKIRKPEIS